MPPSIQKTQKAECFRCNDFKDCKLVADPNTKAKAMVCEEDYIEIQTEPGCDDGPLISTEDAQKEWKSIGTDGYVI